MQNAEALVTSKYSPDRPSFAPFRPCYPPSPAPMPILGDSLKISNAYTHKLGAERHTIIGRNTSPQSTQPRHTTTTTTKAPSRHLPQPLPTTFADPTHLPIPGAPSPVAALGCPLPNWPTQSCARKRTPVDSLHKRMVVSQEPETIMPGVTQTELTPLEWPSSVFNNSPVMRGRSQLWV